MIWFIICLWCYGQTCITGCNTRTLTQTNKLKSILPVEPNFFYNNNNNGLLYSAHVCHSVTLLALNHYYPALAPLPLRRSSITRNNFLPGTHLLHLGRERQLWTKYLRPKGIRTEQVSNPQPSDNNN